MATAESKTAKKDTVTIELFKDEGKYKAPVFVGVNGKTWLIPRGVKVEVPACVAEVLENSAKAQKEAAKYRSVHEYK